ncbi:MAG: hypothetical protein HC850_15475 [Rhodomicrobium sp.]|nr:hypothetical protein [Rhodomicrobium sp.]
MASASGVGVKLKSADGAPASIDIILVEKDGSSWRSSVSVENRWSESVIPLSELQFSRSIHIPSPYPRLWNYWRSGAQPRRATEVRPTEIERLELSVRNGEAGGQGVDIQSVWLEF